MRLFHPCLWRIRAADFATAAAWCAALLFPALAEACDTDSVHLLDTADPFVQWVETQRAPILQRIEIDHRYLLQAASAIEAGQHAEAEAEKYHDAEAHTIAQTAIAGAEDALTRLRATLMHDSTLLRSLDRAIALRTGPSPGMVPGTIPGREFALVIIRKGDLYRETSNGREPFDGSKPLVPGEEVATGAGAYAEVVLTDGSRIGLDENSSFKLDSLSETGSMYDRIKGRLHVIADHLRSYRRDLYLRRYHLQCVIGSVRGTEFTIAASESGTIGVTVLDGAVELQDTVRKVTVMLKAGERLDIAAGGMVGKPGNADSSEIERWWKRDEP